jgi:DNA-binding NarL/FixJ family response regulator
MTTHLETRLVPNTLRVLVIDDHRSFGEALSIALDIEPGIESLGQCISVQAGLDLVMDERPNVVIIDWQMDGIDGIEGIRRIRVADRNVKLIMITGHADPALRRMALTAGAAAVLPKDTTLSEIATYVRAVAAGKVFDEPDEESEDRAAAPTVRLSPREVEVLWLLSKGKDTPTIAATLFLSVHTVRSYTRDLLQKLGAHSQLEAIAIARRTGMIPLND